MNAGAFCYAKARNVTPEIAAKHPGAGDVWTWAAIDADSKLIPCWIIGQRDGVTARIFVNDLASRLANRIQLTSDGLNVYLAAVERAFRGEVDYAQLIKSVRRKHQRDRSVTARPNVSGLSARPLLGTPILSTFQRRISNALI